MHFLPRSFNTWFESYSLIISWIGTAMVVVSTLLLIASAVQEKGWFHFPFGNHLKKLGDKPLLYLIYSLGFAMLVFRQLTRS